MTHPHSTPKEVGWACPAQMVRGIIDGTVTSFRELMKQPPIKPWIPNFCRYQVGQRVWVKETWCRGRITQTEPNRETARYRSPKKNHYQRAIYKAVVYGPENYKWRASTTMPKWASRLTLEVTGVRVEQDAGKWFWRVDFKRIGKAAV